MAKEDYKGIWVFAEQQNGKLNNTVLEILAKAQELKAHTGEDITAVLLGKDVSGLAQTLFEYGADQVILAEDSALEQYSARPYQAALTQLAEKYKPSIILYGATSLGRDLAPRMMISLKTGLTADAIDLGFDKDDVFYQTTPAYGGSILAHIVILEKRPQMATVRPMMFDPIEPKTGAQGKLISEKVDVKPDPDFEVLETAPKEDTGEAIEGASVIVSGGRGIKSEEDLAQLKKLADLLGGKLASSRPLVDVGWLPHEKQIGQSGTTVKPKYIINVGISGSVQYQVGMQNSGCIISINHTKGAPIFDISHYGAVADYKTVIPALIEEIEKRKAE
jgi:electron transfer flavoprotein alpha subunit